VRRLQRATSSQCFFHRNPMYVIVSQLLVEIKIDFHFRNLLACDITLEVLCTPTFHHFGGKKNPSTISSSIMFSDNVYETYAELLKRHNKGYAIWETLKSDSATWAILIIMEDGIGY
jgi:hypothetical protein